MAYVTWTEVADTVEGEKRLRETVLAGRGDTAAVHPYFDSIVATASQMVDNALEKAGFETPLAEPLQDLILHKTVIGLVIGEATQSTDSLAKWMQDMVAAARLHLEQIKSREYTVLGAISIDGTQIEAMIDASIRTDTPVFDIGDPDAQMHDVFADLGPGTRGWWN